MNNTCISTETTAVPGKQISVPAFYNFNKIYFIIGANGGARVSCTTFPALFLSHPRDVIISCDEVIEGYTAFIQFHVADCITINAVGTQGWTNPPTIAIYASY